MRIKLLAAALLLTPFALHPALQDAPQDGKAKAAEAPVVGQPAPAIRLNDDTGTAVAVGGKGERWTVLAFYPKAATPG